MCKSLHAAVFEGMNVVSNVLIIPLKFFHSKMCMQIVVLCSSQGCPAITDTSVFILVFCTQTWYSAHASRSAHWNMLQCVSPASDLKRSKSSPFLSKIPCKVSDSTVMLIMSAQHINTACYLASSLPSAHPIATLLWAEVAVNLPSPCGAFGHRSMIIWSHMIRMSPDIRTERLTGV